MTVNSAPCIHSALAASTASYTTARQSAAIAACEGCILSENGAGAGFVCARKEGLEIWILVDFGRVKVVHVDTVGFGKAFDLVSGALIRDRAGYGGFEESCARI